MHFEWSGHQSKPVLLFSNSLGSNLRMWDPQIAAFSEHFRILRYDKRGHGQSSVPPGPYTIDQFGNDVLNLLDFLQLDRVFFCGLSIGGGTGMFLGANAHERFHKLAVCNTSPKFANAEFWNARIQAVESGGMKAVAGGLVERWLTLAFRSTHPDETQALLFMLEAADPEGYIAGCAAVRDMDMRQTVQKIRVPTLVLAGTHDAGATVADARFLTDNIPGARYAEVSAAHISNIEAAADFNRHILQFFLS
jgi:3-oxoadipate enol-lactonase